MYEKRFQGWIDQGVTAESIEAMYSEAMEKIREDPSKKPATPYVVDKQYKKPGKISLEERKQKVALKKAAQKERLAKALAEGGADEEEEEEEEEEDE